MNTRFAAAQTRLNRAVQAHLNNVQAVLDGTPVAGRFDVAYAQAFDGISATVTAITLDSAVCANATNTSMLAVGDKTYRVRAAQPDGTGETTLILERTA